jgi:hypothetical protein
MNMHEMMGESDQDAWRRQTQSWQYDKFAHEQKEQDREDRARGYVDIGGYNVPYHLQSLVLEHDIHPDKVCAIADLFDSTEDFFEALSGAKTNRREARLDEVEARWARIAEEEAARQASGLYPIN